VSQAMRMRRDGLRQHPMRQRRRAAVNANNDR
jgi:hypothetical protein